MITREHIDTAGCVSGAIYSDCERYRYRLWRTWDASKPSICFVMLNPSTATEVKNDPTIERCQTRAVRLGFGTMEIANLFPYRSTDPAELYREDIDPVGPLLDANSTILDAIKDSQVIVCGWGSHKIAQPRAREVRNLIAMAGMADRMHALKLNQDGSPQHPLYVSYAATFQRYL